MTAETTSSLPFPLQTKEGRRPESNLLQAIAESSLLKAYFMESYIYNINNFMAYKNAR